MAEEHLTKAAEIARRSGISYEELCEVLKMLYDGE